MNLSNFMPAGEKLVFIRVLIIGRNKNHGHDVMRGKAVVGTVHADSKILIGKKRRQNNHEMSEEWHIPDGRVNKNETLQDALKREILEEKKIHAINTDSHKKEQAHTKTY